MALLIFDLDGVIRDRSRLAYYAVREAFLKHGIEFNHTADSLWKLSGVWVGDLEGYVSVLLNVNDAENLLKIIFNLNHPEEIQMYSKAHPLAEEISISIRHNLSDPKYRKYVSIYPGSKEALEFLSKKHTITALTNSSRESLERDIPFLDIFECVLTKEEVPKKPNPEGILRLYDMFNEKEVYMIGDTVYDLMAAKNAGVYPVAVSYGQGLITHLKKYNPVRIIERPRDLVNVCD